MVDTNAHQHLDTLKEEILARLPQRAAANESFARKVHNNRIAKMQIPEFDEAEAEAVAKEDVSKEGGPTMPRAGETFVEPALQNFNIYWQQNAESFVEGSAVPTVTVQKPKGSYWQWDSAPRKRNDVKPMSQGDEATESFVTLSDDTYEVKKYGHKTSVEDDTVDAQEMSVIETARVAVESNAEKVVIDKESLFLDLVLKASSWTDSAKGITNTTAAKNWVGSSSDDPTVDIWTQQTAMGKTGYRPNRLLLTQDVYDGLMVSDEIRSLMNTGVTPTDPLMKPSMALLAALFNVDMIHVAGGVVADAERDIGDQSDIQTDYFDSGKALLYYAPASVGRFTATGISKFAWQRPGFNGMGEQVRSWYEQPKSKTCYQTIFHVGYKINSLRLGYLWTGLTS